MNIAVYSGSFNPLHIGHLAIIKHMIEEAGFDMIYLIVSPKNPLKDGISSATGRDRYDAAVVAVNRYFASGEVTEAECVDDIEAGCGNDMLLTDMGSRAVCQCSFGPLQRAETEVKEGGSVASDSDTGTPVKVKVDDIELNMPEPHYTVRTLKALKEREPENIFTFVMGADNLADIRRWREYQTILKNFGVAVFPRTGHDLKQIKQDLMNEDPAYKIQIMNAPLVNISSTQIREAIASGKDISEYLI